MQTKTVGTVMVQAIRAREIKLHTGEEALAVLGKEDFQAGWDALYEACPWATMFQGRTFVTAWYQVYHAQFVPIVVTATAGGKLTGLLTLATPVREFNRKKGRIIGAGKYDAAYQNWLSETAQGARFIKDALRLVMKAFPAFSIHLRYVTNPAPLGWVKEPKWRSRCLVEVSQRPLMEMKDPSISKLLNKAEFKRKINRLKRLGEVEFRQITCKKEFEALQEELTVMFDFRQGAKFNLNQYRDDPSRIDFIRALFDRGLSYFTVLRVNGQLQAAICGVAEKDWMFFASGFITHSPFRAKYYSPGFVQIILLSQLLAKEGKSVLDLTTGGDFYKSRMATRHDDVYELILTNSWFYYIKRYLRYQYFRYLEKAGKWPMGTMLTMRKRGYLLKAGLRRLKKQGVLQFAREKVKQWVSKPKTIVYAVSPTGLPTTAPFSINKNSLRDMLCFECQGTWTTRWEFLDEALERYETGHSSYTYCEDGRLLACVWVTGNEEADKEQNAAASTNSVHLHSFYCHPLGQAKQKAFLVTVAAAVANEEKGEKLYAVAPDNDKTLCRVLETLGFEKAK